jgi:hypothetical protein
MIDLFQYCASLSRLNSFELIAAATASIVCCSDPWSAFSGTSLMRFTSVPKMRCRMIGPSICALVAPKAPT